jgi:hypothetical protein
MRPGSLKLRETTMTKEQEQDSIERLKEVLKKPTLEMMKDQDINVHRIAERMVERFGPPPSEHSSQEGGELCRAFVKSSVQSIYAEEKLRQHFEKHPGEARSYKDFWGRIM